MQIIKISLCMYQKYRTKAALTLKLVQNVLNAIYCTLLSKLHYEFSAESES